RDRGDPPGKVLCFALAPGVSELRMMGEPEEIVLRKGGGIEGHSVDGGAGELKSGCGVIHGVRDLARV
ncbi:hypothetical protein GQM09_21490, partial [Escherichia coli]|nr:hypothetical protein [Escherichia coli]